MRAADDDLASALEPHLGWMLEQQRSELFLMVLRGDFEEAIGSLEKEQKRFPRNVSIRKAREAIERVAVRHLTEKLEPLDRVAVVTGGIDINTVTPRVRRVIDLIDGEATLDEVLRRSAPAGRLAHLKILHRLIDRGVVTMIRQRRHASSEPDLAAYTTNDFDELERRSDAPGASRSASPPGSGSPPMWEQRATMPDPFEAEHLASMIRRASEAPPPASRRPTFRPPPEKARLNTGGLRTARELLESEKETPPPFTAPVDDEPFSVAPSVESPRKEPAAPNVDRRADTPVRKSTLMGMPPVNPTPTPAPRHKFARTLGFDEEIRVDDDGRPLPPEEPDSSIPPPPESDPDGHDEDSTGHDLAGGVELELGGVPGSSDERDGEEHDDERDDDDDAPPAVGRRPIDELDDLAVLPPHEPAPLSFDLDSGSGEQPSVRPGEGADKGDEDGDGSQPEEEDQAAAAAADDETLPSRTSVAPPELLPVGSVRSAPTKEGGLAPRDIALAVLAAVVVIAVGYLLTSSGNEERPPPRTDDATPTGVPTAPVPPATAPPSIDPPTGGEQPAATTARVTIDVTPDYGSLTIDGAFVPAPFVLMLPVDGKERTLRASAPGHATKIRKIIPTADATIKIELTPVSDSPDKNDSPPPPPPPPAGGDIYGE